MTGLGAGAANRLRWALRRVEPPVEIVGAGPSLRTVMDPAVLAALSDHEGGGLSRSRPTGVGRWLQPSVARLADWAPLLAAAALFVLALIPGESTARQMLAFTGVGLWLLWEILRHLAGRRFPGTVRLVAVAAVAAALLVNLLVWAYPLAGTSGSDALGLLALAVAAMVARDDARFRDSVVVAGVGAFVVIAAITAVVWLVTSDTVSALLFTGAVLTLSGSPALVLAAALTEASALVRAAHCGVVFQRPALLWRSAAVERLRVARKGVLVGGAAAVVAVEPAAGISPSELLRLAAALEAAGNPRDRGPILREAEERHISVRPATGWQGSSNGVSGSFEGHELMLGDVRYIANAGLVNPIATRVAEYTREGHVVRALAVDRRVVGLLAIAEAARDDAPRAIAVLRRLGVTVEMVSDGEAGATDRLAESLGIQQTVDRWTAPVAVPRSGFAAALAAPGADDAIVADLVFYAADRFEGEPVTTDSVRLLGEPLRSIGEAIAIGRRTRATARSNVALAMVYSATLVPFASGMFLSRGVWLDPLMTLAVTVLSTLSVALAAARLRVADISHPNGDSP